MKDRSRQFYILLFILALIVNFSGITDRFFTDDPALYASIAKNIIYKNNFWDLFTYNQDWLDKPHFPFWMAFFSFKLFGVSEWAYRLPALLFFLLGCLYTYLFTRKYYGSQVAVFAVLILMTALNVLMGNTDVRAEPYLIGLIIGSIYHVSNLQERFKFTDLLLAALFTACAMMTKGIFVIIPIYGGLLVQLIFQKKLQDALKFKWLLLIVLTAIFVLPELYALYMQFDMHPEKVVFGKQHVSGIRWFFWDSQFGRFASSGPITRKSADVFFFLHTLLWAFAPWCLLFYYAVYSNLKSIFKKEKLTEYYTLGGGLLLLLLFSVSRFQLPFYTNSIFPLFAVITAPYCCKQLSRFGAKYRLITQQVYMVLLLVVVIVIDFLSHPIRQVWFALDLVVCGTVMFFIASKVERGYQRVFMFSCVVILFANFFLNTVFYNQLAEYKGQISAAQYINQDEFNTYHLYSLRTENNLFQFYCKRPVDYIPLEKFSRFKPADSSVFYASQPSIDELLQNHVKFKVMRVFTDYPQENILPAFINRSTRYETLGRSYLITQ